MGVGGNCDSRRVTDCASGRGADLVAGQPGRGPLQPAGLWGTAAVDLPPLPRSARRRRRAGRCGGRAQRRRAGRARRVVRVLARALPAFTVDDPKIGSGQEEPEGRRPRCGATKTVTGGRRGGGPVSRQPRSPRRRGGFPVARVRVTGPGRRAGLRPHGSWPRCRRGRQVLRCRSSRGAAGRC